MYDLIIIGGGPGGITAAIYAARKQLKFAIIYKEIGGEVAKTTVIENYTGYKSVTGQELATLFEEHMKTYSPEIIEDEVVNVERTGKIFKVTTHEKVLDTKTVILSTGAVPKMMNIPGEKEFASRGVSWCAICDAPLFSGKDVAVIGAGNTGLTSTLSLLDIANKVYLISKYKDPKADEVMVAKAKKNPKLEIVEEGMTKSINGSKFVESIIVQTPTGERTIPVQGVFINIGYTPNTRCLKGIVNLDNFGSIIVDANNMTNVPGIFACGDVTDAPYKQILIAAAAGANALLGAYDYISRTQH
jgi:thioredoxin-disulfide reductase